MSDTTDRPNERSARVPLHVPIELGHGDFEDAFAADGVNLSKGGLSLRANCLPDPGSRLAVRFRCEPSGRLVSAQGEVVWAHLDGKQRGEFGLAFIDLDPETEWLIEEMIAAHDGGDGAHAGSADSGPRVAQLELEGSSEPIAARVVRADGDSVVFEQRLDLLKLGRGVRAYGEGEQPHAGAISAVELRMVGSVPMLAVTVAFDGDGAPALGSAEQDTEPDLDAPAAPARPLRAGARENATLVEFRGAREIPDIDLEFDLIPDLEPEPEPEPDLHAHVSARSAVPADSIAVEDDVHERPTLDPSMPAALRAAEPRVVQPQPSEPPARKSQPSLPPPQLEPTLVVTTEAVQRTGRTPHSVGAARVASAPAARISTAPAATPAARSSAPSPVAHARDWSTSFQLDDPSGDPPPDPEQLELPPFEPEPPALQVALLALWRALRRHGATLSAATRRALGVAYRNASPEVRAHVLRGTAAVHGLYSDRVGPQLGAMRRLVLGRLTGRRRRKTSSPHAAQPAPRSGLGRTVLIGLLAACSIGLGVYALAPVGEDEPVLHRGVDPNAVAPISPVSSTAPVDMIGAPVLVPPDPKLVPSEHGVPASSPFAIDVRDKKAAAARKTAPAAATAAAVAPVAASPETSAAGTTPGPRKLRFGAATAPRGRRFALRMSGKIQSLAGSDDPGGFTVSIAGCLALDRAGPIASAHGAVERSMVINRGDHAELTVRFDAGKHPAYQIVAEGSTLYVTIQDL